MRLGLRLGGGAAGVRRVPPEPGVTDPPRTTTNETRTETPIRCGIEYQTRTSTSDSADDGASEDMAQRA
jgi:hypothetical protein